MQTKQLQVLFIFFIAFFAGSCNNSGAKSNVGDATKQYVSTAFSVSGKIRGIDSGWVYFSRLDTVKTIRFQLDSARVTKGSFEFKGNITHPQPHYIGFKHRYKVGNAYKESSMVFNKIIFIEPGKLNVTGHRDSLKYMITTGGKAQAEYDAFEAQKTVLNNNVNDTYDRKINAKGKSKKVLDSINTALNGYYGQIREMAVEQVKRHPNSYVSAYIAYSYLAKADVAVLKPTYELLSADVQSSYFGKELSKLFQASVRTAIGQVVPDFSIPNTNGKNSGPEAFRGKYVLVDFWASWCAPCRAENPNLRSAYSRFQQKGFDILSVSMDDNKEKWLQAVKEDKLPWTQLSDLKGSKSPLMGLYGIQTIPVNFLLDKEGKIIARNLRGGDLEKKLEEVMGK